LFLILPIHFFSEVALDVEAEAKSRNCNVILYNTNHVEEEEKNILISYLEIELWGYSWQHLQMMIKILNT
jgi:DNA-binding LacI/PurR family transcriptional regulator